MRNFLTISTFCFSILHCLVTNADAARYSNNIKYLNKSLLELFPDFKDRQILSGNLNPKLENKLFQNASGNLYVIINGKFQRNSDFHLTKDSFERNDSDFILNIEYTKLKWEKENLYKVKRNQFLKKGVLKPSIFFQNISKIIRLNPKDSLTQIQLCKVTLCTLEELNNNKLLTYEFNEATNNQYPEFFNKFAPRFDHLNFQLTAIADNDSAKPILIENQKRKISFSLPLDGEQIWKSPKKIELFLDFSLKTYGVTFRVKDMRYILNHKVLINGETLTGKFVGTPHHTLDGRFFYVIPQGVVDFFIPGNIEEYIKKGLILVTVGTDGKSGNRFKAKYIGTGNSAYLQTESQSEIFQKRFSLFANNNESQNPQEGDIDAFIKDLWMEIAKDLNHSY